MDASGLDDCSVRILTALISRPGQIRAVEDLCAFLGEDPANVDRALQLLERGGWVMHYWIPTEAKPGRPRRQYVELTRRGAENPKRLLSGAGRRGVIGTFLWEGSDAAKLAWSGRRQRNHSHEVFRQQRKHDGAPTRYYKPEGILAILRREGWAAAYGALLERRRADRQRRSTKPW